MTDPISNQQFIHDFQKFVWQEPNAWVVNYKSVPKPFNLDAPEKPEKPKKDLDKEKDPKKRNR